MTFSDQSRYIRRFQQVVHKGGESKINDIQIFHNAKDLANFSEKYSLHPFFENFQKDVKYSAQMARHQAELSREETFVDEK